MKKMTYFPQNADCIENIIGSASGYHFHHQNRDIYVFPGVPTEMKEMVQQTLFFEINISSQNNWFFRLLVYLKVNCKEITANKSTIFNILSCNSKGKLVDALSQKRR